MWFEVMVGVLAAFAVRAVWNWGWATLGRLFDLRLKKWEETAPTKSAPKPPQVDPNIRHLHTLD